MLAGAALLRVPLSQAAVDRLLAFATLLRRWNQAFNLVSRNDVGRLITRHLVDGLVAVSRLSSQPLIDLGSGGGIPGVVIALARPELQVTLLDRSNKKVRFLRQVKAELVLNNTEIVAADATTDACPHGFEQVIFRALAQPPDLFALLRRPLAATGVAYWMRGPQRFDDVVPGGLQVVEEWTYQLPAHNTPLRLTQLRWQKGSS